MPGGFIPGVKYDFPSLDEICYLLSFLIRIYKKVFHFVFISKETVGCVDWQVKNVGTN